jgi:RNA recognition motif-containing protein
MDDPGSGSVPGGKSSPSAHDPMMSVPASVSMAAPTEPPQSARIYVGNIPWSVTDEALGAMFSPVGRVVEAKVRTFRAGDGSLAPSSRQLQSRALVTQIMMDRHTGRSRGYGFVTFATVEEAVMAIRESPAGGSFRWLTVRRR